VLLGYDLVIIGRGPAALAAAVYAARQKIRFAVIAENIGGQATISADIENYLGFSSTTGPELSAICQESPVRDRCNSTHGGMHNPTL